MSSLLTLLPAWGTAFLVNLVPAFMPPTWTILAFFYATGHPPLLPLTIGGAAMSALGRAALARLSHHLGRFLPASARANAEALAGFITRHPSWRDAIVFAYCLGPFPSNALFIAAGIARVPLRRVALVFFLSRAIADTFWVWTTVVVVRDLGQILSNGLTNWLAIALQVGSLAAVAVLVQLPWARWLRATAAERRGGLTRRGGAW